MVLELSERVGASVVVKAGRANEVAGKRKLSTFCLVIGDGTAYFIMVTRDVPRVHMYAIV